MRSTESQQCARGIIRELHALGNPVKAEGVQQYFKHAIVALGIDTPTLRGYGREQVRILKARWPVGRAISLCDELLQEPELEVRGMGILILAGFRQGIGTGLLPTAKRWLSTRLDNWALVDTFCGEILSPLLAAHPGAVGTFRQWSAEEKGLWIRRGALVTLVPFARRGQYLDLAYDLAQEHFGDPEDLMHKAVGWLLREAGKTDMKRLQSFLLRHGPSIPRTSLRYAVERFAEPVRKKLLLSTRAA